MKKAFLIIGALALILGAGSLWADTNWEGTYGGDAAGEWWGTIYDNPSGETPYFQGVWYSTDSDEHGSLYAVLNPGPPGYYRAYDGIIYDEYGNNIGTWYGSFYAASFPGTASGRWRMTDVDLKGEWSGYSPPLP